MRGLLCLRSSLTLLQRLKVGYASGDKRAFVHLHQLINNCLQGVFEVPRTQVEGVGGEKKKRQENL